MPPQSKKQRKVIPAAIISDLDQPQDYIDPIKKLAFNPGQTTAERVVAAAGKRPVVRPKARVSKVARRLADQPAMQFDENARMTPAELADYQLPDEREAEARRFEELTTVPDITLSASGAIQPGSGLVLSSMMRYGYQGLNRSLALTGQVLQDAFGSDDMPTVLGSLGQALSNIAKESAPTFENYDIARPVKERGALDRTVGFLTQLGIQLPQMAVATELLGPAAGFGVYKAESLHAAGEQDAATLAGAFVQGAAEGALLSALGKTAQVVERSKGTNAVSKLLKKSPVAAQAGAQLVGGMAQTGVDGMLHPGQPAPDWLDYLHGGVANVIMDPVVLGGSGRSRKATQAATRMSGELDPSSYNLDLPPDNLAALRQDFWQPQDLPWDNHTVTGLLNRSRVQYADNPADPEGVLYVNPQAATIIDRVNGGRFADNRTITNLAQGMAIEGRDAQGIAEGLLEKSAQLKEAIRQLPDRDPQLNNLATGAVVYEALAEHLQAASKDGTRPVALRIPQKPKAVDAGNPVAREFDQSVIGHESTHLQTQKIAELLKVDSRSLPAPGWLADHPIGAKVIMGIGDSKSPLQGYEPTEWTAEAIAYAAQPGPDPGLGLSKQERGVLVGDYFAAVMDKHGPGVMEQVWVGRMDREVAQVAFKRLYESNRVRYARDPVSGRRLGLEWRGVEVPKFSERVPAGGYGVETQPFPNRFAMVGSPTRVNKAILLNDLDQRMQTSKVRNARGELIPVYHGSPKGVAIDRLDLDKLNPGDWLKGFFTTQDVGTAGAYSKQSGMGDSGRDGGSNIHKFYLDAKKPLDLDGPVNLDFITEFMRRLGVEPDSSGGSYPEGLMMDVLDYARASLRRSGNIDTQSMAKVRAIKNAIEYDDMELHAQAGELLDEYTKRAQDLRDRYKAAASQNPDGRLRIYQQHAERSEETQLEYWFRQEDRKIQQRKDAHRDQLRKLEIEEGELQRAGRMPNNEVIERIRRVLLDMGYDAATHIGGGERGAKEFKTREEAEAYADETGGKIKETVADEYDISNAEMSLRIAQRDLATARKRFNDPEWQALGINITEAQLNSLEKAVFDAEDNLSNLRQPQFSVTGHRVWIAFHPDQLISATAYEPAVEPFVSANTRLWNQQPDPDYDADILAPTWYSGLERYIKGKVNGPVPAKQLQAQLRNAGLRPGELEWTGVQDWLEEQGSRKVTREEVLAEVARRQVEVREVWKDPADGDAKYATYVQPGESSNYRELLLTLPERAAKTNRPLSESEADRWNDLDMTRNRTPEQEAEFQELERRNNLYLGENPETIRTGRGVGGDYYSSHWEEPNILAHVRMTDRLGSQGEKVLFIEEVQSDWHQTGAKQGYIGDNKALDELDNQRTKAIELADKAYVEYMRNPTDEIYARYEELNKQAAVLTTKLNRMKRDSDLKVPDGPFKKTWPELAMRRMIRYAAENGYDRVAWVRGEDADRSVGGSSSWFYDRNLINTTNNILKKFGSSVVTAKDPVINDKPKVQYVPATRVGWSRDAEGLISLYPIIDGQVRYGGQYNNLTLEDLRLTVDADAYNQVAAAVSSDTHQFAGNPQFDTMVASGVIEGGEAGIGIANDNWRTQVMAAETAGASLAESRHSFEITPAMREAVLYQGQAIPLNIQPDPDYDAANPAGEAADEAAGKLELDPDITHLRKTNASPEISQQVAAQREAERKAYRDVANLRARIRRNNDLAAAATKMQQDAGLSQPELDAEIRQIGDELKQQHVAAVKKFRELRSQGNVLKGQLAGQLGDNTARKRAEAKLAAKGRLANGDQLPPIDAPLDQVRMSNEYGNFLANVAKDMLIASDVPLLDSSEMSTTDQLINAMRIGRTTVPQLDEVAKRYGLKDTVELFERFRQFGSAAGRDLNIFARQQREINKLRGLSPELDDWINSRPPTMQEIDAIANGPSIARQLVNLNIGATIAQLATQTPNVVTGLANATGVRSIINLADQVIERAIGSQRELTGGPGEPSKFEQNSVPPLSTVLAPVFAASTATKDILNNPYWFAHGKLKDGTLNDPADRPAEKSIRIVQELHNFQPELMRKFDSQLSDDVIQIHLLPHADAVQAERDALTLLKNQVTNMPAGADKFARLARIKEAETRLAKSDRWLPKVLHEASRGLHKYLTLARMGERFVRTISLVSNLETEAARYGLDLEQLDTANEIHKLPSIVVERAVNQALQDTYATRPEPGSLTAQAYNWYAKSNDPAAVLTSAVFPFVGFMGNYAKMVLDYSPLPIIKAALAGAGESGPTVENHQKLIKATLGTAVYVAVAAMIEDKYDEAERTGKPVGSWHSVGGVSVRNVPQLVAPLYVADYIARQRRGLAAPEADSALEFFNILAGLDMRNITGTFKWLDDLITAAQDQSGNKGTKAAEAAATAFSDWFGRYLTPLNMYTDIGAQYFTSMRDVKDLYGMGAGSLFAPILNRVPVAREQLSDKIDPYTGMPVHRTDLPAIKAITGFTVLPEQSYPARIFQHAGIKLTDWIPFTGVTEVDRDLVATIGRMMKERTADLEATQQHMDIDQKIVDTYDVARAVADDAFEEVLSRYPEVERKLEDAGEFNRWERRVEDKERKRSGRPSLAEEQLQLMQQRKAAAGSK